MRLHRALRKAGDVGYFVYRIAIDELKRYAATLLLTQSPKRVIEIHLQRRVVTVALGIYMG